MATDPIGKLRQAGRTLPAKTHAAVLALGASVVPHLVDLLADDEGGWASVHAVDLLVDMKAEEAIRPMLAVLDEVELDDALPNRVTIRLPELGGAVLEPALELLSRSDDEDTVYAVCEVLAKLGVRDDRVFDALRSLFDDDPAFAAGMLADYGDERGLHLVDRALADFQPDFSVLLSRVHLGDLLDAHERLGGELSPQTRDRVDGWSAEWDVRQRRSRELSAPPRTQKTGRNEPCPCGSGKKYKKCCLPSDQASRTRVIEGDADVLRVTGNVSTEQLAMAGSFFAEKDAGRGPARQMAEYAQPLLDETDGSSTSVQAALNFAMLFWNLAVTRDDATRERHLAEMKQRIDEAERAEFDQTTRMMVERHWRMFPEMHEKSGTSGEGDVAQREPSG